MFTYITALGLLLTSWLPFVSGPAPARPPARSHAVCSSPASGDGACLAKVFGRADGSVTPAATTKALPAGYSPSQLRSAYKVPLGSGGHVAVVVAYDDPTAKTDLDHYSQQFNLPVLPGCTSIIKTSCFTKVNSRGTAAYPSSNRGWAFEASLDVQTVHGVCPSCRIDLVEANSASIFNLMNGVDRGVALGASVVSMSWGSNEFFSESSYDSHFAVPGVSFVSAAGDWGYGTDWPAASARVVAAGGTTLTLSSLGGRQSETAWSETGSGCSLYEPKPVWQHDIGCATRTMADISADADPATGAAILSSYSPYGSGWFQVGGTSLSTPLIASLIALTGNSSQATVLPRPYSPASSSGLYDITVGSNGSCIPSYLCTAGPGYDGPTGVGAPIGLSAL